MPEDETAVLDPFTDVATPTRAIVEPTTMQGYGVIRAPAAPKNT